MDIEYLDYGSYGGDRSHRRARKSVSYYSSHTEYYEADEIIADTVYATTSSIVSKSKETNENIQDAALTNDSVVAESELNAPQDRIMDEFLDRMQKPVEYPDAESLADTIQNYYDEFETVDNKFNSIEELKQLVTSDDILKTFVKSHMSEKDGLEALQRQFKNPAIRKAYEFANTEKKKKKVLRQYVELISITYNGDSSGAIMAGMSRSSLFKKAGGAILTVAGVIMLSSKEMPLNMDEKLNIILGVSSIFAGIVLFISSKMKITVENRVKHDIMKELTKIIGEEEASQYDVYSNLKECFIVDDEHNKKYLVKFNNKGEYLFKDVKAEGGV